MARRKLNPTGGQIALAAGAAIVGGLALADAYSKPKSSKKKAPPPPLPDPDDQEKMIADELIVLIADDPAPNALYLVEKGKRFADIARDVFSAAGIPDARNDGQARVAYMKCVSSSVFNRTLYGKKDDFTNNFPSWTSPDDVSIRTAWLNKSDNYIQQLLQGHVPVPRSGSKRGLLWLPAVDPAAWNQFGEIVCINPEPPPLAALGQ